MFDLSSYELLTNKALELCFACIATKYMVYRMYLHKCVDIVIKLSVYVVKI